MIAETFSISIQCPISMKHETLDFGHLWHFESFNQIEFICSKLAKKKKSFEDTQIDPVGIDSNNNNNRWKLKIMLVHGSCWSI